MTEHILDGTPADVIARYERLPQIAMATDFGKLDRNIVVLDTETTGLSFVHDELIQIAAARLEQGEITDWYVTFVSPGKPLPEDIVHLTNIHESDLEDAPTPEQAVQGLVDFAGDAIIVAHNVSFDQHFITRHPVGYPLLQNIWLDSLDMSRIALPRLRSHRLIDLVRTFDAPVSTHRADDDVAATCVIYRILLAAIVSMPLSLVREIGKLTTLAEWPTGYAFKELAEQIERAPITSEAAPAEGPSSASAASPTSAVPPTSPTSSISPTDDPKPLFSLYTMRRARITELPIFESKKDANDLVGSLSFPEEQEIAHAFSAQGILGKIYPDYEPRKEQGTMAEAIRQSFETSTNLVVEAGTGVGKSMAYLVPAMLFAKRNKVAVGVATKTNALLDQLVYQELPALAQAMQQVQPTALAQSSPTSPASFDSENSASASSATSDPTSPDSGPESDAVHATTSPADALTWAPLKGINHYPCLRRVNRLVEVGPAMKDVNGTLVSQAPSLAALLSYIEQSEFDDIDGLKIDYRALPKGQITTSSRECLRKKCPFYGKLCFVHGARRRAEAADIVVTNQTLLFCDIALGGSLLPTARHWIVDEAHTSESEARQAFAKTLSSEQILRLVGRVAPSAAARSIFARAEHALDSAPTDQLTLFYALLSKGKSAGETFAEKATEYTAHVKDLLFFDPGKRQGRNSSYEWSEIWINTDVRKSQAFGDLALVASDLIEAADRLISAVQDLVAYLEGMDEAAVAQRELAACAYELRDIRNAAETIFLIAPDTFAYQAIVHRKKDRLIDRVEALMLDVGAEMNETFYTTTHSVIYTSATLSIAGSFENFEKSIGLNQSEFSQASSLQLDSSYDFDNNMIVYVVSDMPLPNDPHYLEALNRLLIGTHRAQRGSMLTLFTNRREMESSYNAVMPQLKADDLRVVCQKYGVSVKGLRDEFLSDKHLSLFALKSFWEGFNAPGDTLRGVIIPKLPFARPTDPLYCEFASRDDRAWWHRVLPQAVIETKQAAGRLIRKADDHGVLILADRRLVEKSYGRIFLKSLQSKTVRVRTIDEIVEALGLISGL